MYTDYTEENDDEVYYDDENNNKEEEKEKLKKLIIYVLVFLVIFILIIVMMKSCSKKSTSTKTVEKDTPTVILGVETLELEVGKTYEMNVDVLFADASDPVITWVSEDPKIASIDDEGIIKGEAEGETTITAIYKEGNKTYNSSCDVTVKKVTLEKINISPKEISLKVGDKVLIEITPSPENADIGNLKYEIDNSKIATVDDKGNVVGVSEGETVVTVKTEDGKITSTAKVIVSNQTQTVTPSPETSSLKEIKILGLAEGISVGKSVEVIYDINPTDANKDNIKWSSSNSQVAKVEYVDNKVIVTGVNAGSCKITATSTNNVTATLDITINSDKIEPTEIKIVGSTSITMKVGETKFVSYTLTPDSVTEKSVTFTSSDKNVIWVESNGIMAARKKGTAKVTVTTSNGKTATITITVK